MALALLIALLLSQDIRGVSFWRALFFLPSISSLVAVAMVWEWLYHPEFGLVNYALRLLGLDPLGWLTDPSTALISVMIVNIWLGVGYQMVIFLAGLKSIPAAFYESALVDGAGAWQRFRYVTLPLLRPTTFFILVTSIIASFQVFALVFVMTEGGPLNRTDVVVYHIYKNAYDYLKMGYASAMAWILFLVILAATWLQFRFVGKKVSYN
jgi:multiple sugar transport system permease protein